MSEVKKKKVYLLRDRHGEDVRAELRENGELRVELVFPRLIMDETELYGTFVEIGWDLKHEEFVPDIPPEKQNIFIPPNATFH